MIELYLIFVVCLVGCAISSYNIGVRTGAEGMIDQMIANGSHDPLTNKITVVIDGD